MVHIVISWPNVKLKMVGPERLFFDWKLELSYAILGSENVENFQFF